MSDDLDPAAADRVLRRASELAGSGDAGDDDHDGTGIDPAALVAAAVDVGIPERAVRRSLAIERLGPPPEGHRLDGLVGEAVVADERFVPAEPDRILDLLDRWLVGGHHLRRERRRPGEMEWSRRTDLLGGVRRTMRGLTGEGRLADVARVRAVVRPVDGGETAVRVTVDRSAHRRRSLVTGSVLGGGGAAIGIVGLAASAPFVFAAIPVGIAGGAVVASSRREADRVERELPRLVDAVEEDRIPEGMLVGLRRRLLPRRS